MLKIELEMSNYGPMMQDLKVYLQRPRSVMRSPQSKIPIRAKRLMYLAHVFVGTCGDQNL